MLFEKVEILPFVAGPLATNTYLVICKTTRKAAIIDPAFGVSRRVIEALAERECVPVVIILTHSHFDHIADCARLMDHFGLDVWVHREDAYNLREPGADGLGEYFPMVKVEPARLLEDQDEFLIGDNHFRVIHTPGHSPGSVCLYCEKEGILLSGDTLFQGSIGSLSLPTSEPERMWPSLKKLSVLPKTTVVFPGHGEKTTIGQEFRD